MLSIDSSDLVTDPFPYIVKENILPADLFAQLNDSFPGDEVFSRQDAQWGGGRKNLVKAMPVFHEFVSASPAWNQLYGYINSRAFVAKLLDIFGEEAKARGAVIDTGRWGFSDFVEPLHLSAAGRMSAREYYARRLGVDRVYDRVMQGIKGDQLYVTFDIARSRSGYEIPVHTDNRYKMFLMLVYFNDVTLEGGSGGELLLHKHVQNLPDAEFPRYPGEENTTVVARVKPRPNLGVIALNCNNAYHSATPLDMESGYRRFLYIGVCKRHTKSMWAHKAAIADRAADARGN